MLKKIKVIFLALVISAASLSGCNNNTSAESSDKTSSAAVQSADQINDSSVSEIPESTVSSDESSYEMFADGDYRDVESEEPNATITLSGDTGTISDTARGSSGSEVIINSKGIYEISGSSEDVSIIINDDNKSGNVYLILNNVDMKNSEEPCIYVQNSEKVIIQCVGENTLTYSCESSSDGLDGAIYSKDDVTINGSGSLNIDSKLHGIVCKDDLKITDSVLSVTADSIGLKAGDSVRIGGGETSINSQHDGIQVENSSGDSCFYIESGTLNIDAYYDGIDVGGSGEEFSGFVKLSGGSVDITSGNGSANSKNSDTSQKGIKCDGDIIVEDVELTVDSADDSFNSDGSVTVSGGTLNLSASDDGITAASTLSITEGDINISKSYEGLEAADIVIDGGTISVVSSDDGINTGGGSDSSSEEVGPWGESNNGTLTINGGTVTVDSSGDGLDSNGSIYITGGTVIVEGPTDNGNGALDKGDGSDCVASITGGTVIAIGSAGMAINFDSGTQCSALVSLSGDSGTEITVDDGSDLGLSGFSFTANKKFECIVYSSPNMTEGNTYTITAGSESTTADFTSGLYYSEISGMGKGNDGDHGMR